MIKTLGIEHGLLREDAYMLCSVAGDLRMHEVVRRSIISLPSVLILVRSNYPTRRSICQTMWYVYPLLPPPVCLTDYHLTESQGLFALSFL